MIHQAIRMPTGRELEQLEHVVGTATRDVSARFNSRIELGGTNVDPDWGWR
jgi:hypothetical protein